MTKYNSDDDNMEEENYDNHNGHCSEDDSVYDSSAKYLYFNEDISVPIC